jgi:hypothetical protein
VISTNANGATSVYATDVDGDGDIDVLSASGLDNTIAWYESDGGTLPGFTKWVISTNAINARSVYATDVDGDGDTDVLSASIADGKIAWYENVPPPVRNETDRECFDTIADAIAAAGHGDVITAEAGQFPAAPVIDFAGKGLTLQSRGAIEQPAGGLYTLADNAALEAEVGFDIDLDGELAVPAGADVDVAADALLSGPEAALTINSGAGVMVNADAGAMLDGQITLGVNALATFSGDATLASGLLAFSKWVIRTDVVGAYSVYATDVDGDGDTDLLSASYTDNKIAWYENNGASPPVLIKWVISNTAYGARSVYATDVDGDGDTDVLSASSDDDTIAWYESDGGSPPGFTKRVIRTDVNGANSVYATDMDGDGDTDALSASYTDNKIAWYENNGASPPVLIKRVISTAAYGAQSVYATDVDGDGDTDVLSASYTDNKIAWYESDGGSPPGFTERVISTAAYGAECVYATDVDGDGDTDVLSASSGNNTFAWYENDGAPLPGFTERVISSSAISARSVYATDVDGDGDTDVLSASSGNNTIAWYESDGGSPPGFTERVISTTADGARSVYATDVDGDGDTDVLSASETDDTIAWYENLTGSTSLSAGSALVAAGALVNDGPLAVFGGTVSSGGPLDNSGLLRLLDGQVEAGSGLANTGFLEGYGDIAADLTNDGEATFFGDTYVIGDCTNTSTIVIQNGTLTILGTLSNSGQIIGDLFGGGAAAGASAGVDGFFVQGTFTVAPTASLLMASEAAVVRIGGAYDVAIDDNLHYHMAQAELRMVGSGQTMELMSTDIGPDEAGLDRTLPGHFPVGTLRLGPMPTTVNLADNHDNDGLGQALCEAIYVESLIIDAGATLNTNGCRVYYGSAQIDGNVDDPANVVEIVVIPPCPCDCEAVPDGTVDVGDFLMLLAQWGNPGACDCEDPPDGVVDVGDFLAILAAWGLCP